MTAPGDRAEAAIPRALELVGAVRRWDRLDVAAALTGADLQALCIALAAMVDDDRPLTDLLGWTERLDLVEGWTWPNVLAAHSQWELHRSRGLTPPPEVQEGQRLYDRVRSRQRRAAARAQAAA